MCGGDGWGVGGSKDGGGGSGGWSGVLVGATLPCFRDWRWRKIDLSIFPVYFNNRRCMHGLGCIPGTCLVVF